MPPLRERKEVILLLANHFAARMAFELGRQEIPQFSQEAVAALERYHWPGNVRELKNLVERAVYRSDSTLITDIVFDPFRSSPLEFPPTEETPSVAEPSVSAIEGLMDKPLKTAVRELEVRLLEQTMRRCKYNQRKAARALGLTYHQFRGLYRKYRGEIE